MSKRITLVLLTFLLLTIGCEWNLQKRPDHNYIYKNFEQMVDVGIIDLANGITQAEEGFYILGNQSNGSGDNRSFVIKVNNQGEHVWTTEINNMDEGCQIQNINNSQLYVAGTTFIDDTTSSIVLENLSFSGSIGWSQLYGLPNSLNTIGSFLQFGNNFYLAGGTDAIKVFGNESYIIQTNDVGNSEKTSYYYNINTGVDDNCLYAIETSDRNIVMLSLINKDSKSSIKLVKLDGSNKTILWQYLVLENCLPLKYKVVETSDQNYLVVAAISTDNQAVSTSNTQLNLIKIENSGEKILSKKTISNVDVQQNVNFLENNSGEIIILTGGFQLIKTSSAGDEIWRKSFSGRCDGIDCLLQTPDGGYVFVGSSSKDTSSNSDITIIKTDPDGKLSFSE
ncbi:MAG: hypothetical protein JXB49_15375 [Bacteroidales bacterium]|nr:hypothetical protein [Bacteroidales bacterium]MBN2817958.1 hypothetical protein [Bacteroidales bacterium]